MLTEILQTHIDYSAWASHRLVEAASQLPPEELAHDFKTGHHSILATLVHVFAADRIWLARAQNEPPKPFVTEADHSLTVLQNDWPLLHERWRKWGANLTEETAQAELSYADLKGNRWQNPAWQIALHVVNHATHHRGQVSGFFRALGHTPPGNDLMGFYRQAMAAK